MAISTAWITNLHLWGRYSRCAVTRAEGNTQNNAETRVDYEQYDSYYSDPTGNYYALGYVDGCNPPGETEIGSDTTK